MKSLPSLLIVADRGRMLAYLPDESGVPRLHATTEFKEGNEKISELVTDQAGAFPNSGSAGTSSAERLPLEAEMELRCFRKIAEQIEQLLKLDGVTEWGFCAPSEIHGAILDLVSRDALEHLAAQVRRDLVNASPEQVKDAFHNLGASPG